MKYGVPICRFTGSGVTEAATIPHGEVRALRKRIFVIGLSGIAYPERYKPIMALRFIFVQTTSPFCRETGFHQFPTSAPVTAMRVTDRSA